MTHLEILVEELSAEAALMNILPKLVVKQMTYNIHPFNGKGDMMKNMPGRLKGYGHWIPSDWRIIVLVDRDNDDCLKLKQEIQRYAQNANLATRSKGGTNAFQVGVRLAIEELEAWFFGDVEAIVGAYPRVPRTLDRRAKYRNSDGIRGGTWESLERVLQNAGYYLTGMPKIQVAKDISRQMDPSRNKSTSFRAFRNLVLLAQS